MPPPPVDPAVFPRLQRILYALAAGYAVQTDTPDNFTLNMRGLIHKKKPVFFASVVRNKNYVSFHLMPLYMNPTLDKQVPAALAKRRQGKACFNFAEVDEPLFAQLETLVSAAAVAYPACLKAWGITA